MPLNAILSGTPMAAHRDTSSNDGPTMRIRWPSFLRHRYASISRQYRLVSFPDKSQPRQGQIGVDVQNQGRLGRNERREAAGRHAERAAPELRVDPPHEPLDHPDIAIEQAGLDGADRRLADHAGRLSH